MFKLKKKANIDTATAALMGFVSIAVILLVFGMTMVMANVFYSKTLNMDIITQLDAVNDTNASDAIREVQTTTNDLIDWTDLVILIAIFSVLFVGLMGFAVWGYMKMRG